MKTPPNPWSGQAPIAGVKHVLLVGSGKGGVGKSTVSLNLACAFKRTGLRVGILDGDIYGPSIPRMMGALNQSCAVEGNKIHPLQYFGIKLMSLGLLVEEARAVVWRGPMLFKAIGQFLRDVLWGELDLLLVDLPPGTGDVALTLAQKVPSLGAVLVCTPQNIALADAKKACDMFSQVSIKVLGAVENMGPLKVPGQEPVHLFPKGELKQFLAQLQVPLLAQLPFDPAVGQSCEAGVPLIEAEPDHAISKSFLQLAKSLQKTMPQTPQKTAKQPEHKPANSTQASGTPATEPASP